MTKPIETIAKFDGRCSDCSGEIAEDDTIVYLPDEQRTVCEVCGGAYMPDDPIEALLDGLSDE